MQIFQQIDWIHPKTLSDFSIIYWFLQIDLCPFVAQAVVVEGWAEFVDFGVSV